jgi:hypothetical protein
LASFPDLDLEFFDFLPNLDLESLPGLGVGARQGMEEEVETLLPDLVLPDFPFFDLPLPELVVLSEGFGEQSVGFMVGLFVVLDLMVGLYRG